MMDGVSAAASVIGIVVATVQSLQALSRTIDGIKSAPGEVRAVQHDLEALTSVFHQLDRHLRTVGTHQTDNTLLPTIQAATDSCRVTCDEFQTLLKHWQRRSTQDRMFWLDRWHIGLFGATRTKAFKERLVDHKGTLSMALQAENLMHTMRSGSVAEDDRRAMVRVLDNQARTAIERAREESRDIEERFRVVLSDSEGNEAHRGGEMAELKRDVKRELELLREANKQLQVVCKESLKRAANARATQKIYGVKATNESTALAGYINAEDLGEVNQDIRDVTADQKSVAVAGVAKDLDFASLFSGRK
ncbi:hypothetical protein ACHAQA_008984 [Verticillium albo-atrum]